MFLGHPEIAPDNNDSERAAAYRKVTGGARSNWGADSDLYAAARSTVSTATRQGSHAFDFIRNTLKPATG
jgi:transposase